MMSKPMDLDTAKATIYQIVTILNNGGTVNDVAPEIDWDATRDYEGGGDTVLVVLGGHVLRRTGPNPTTRGASGNIPWPGEYPDGLWYDANESA